MVRIVLGWVRVVNWILSIHHVRSKGHGLEEDLVQASLSTPIQGFHHEKKAMFYPDSFDSSRVRFNTL